jgi:hypothetical protein
MRTYMAFEISVIPYFSYQFGKPLREERGEIKYIGGIFLVLVKDKKVSQCRNSTKCLDDHIYIISILQIVQSDKAW